MPGKKYSGIFNLIIGSMWSGKTSELLRRYNRHTIGGRKCIIIKYANDTRYDNEMVVTHDKIKIQALVCKYLCEVDQAIVDYDVICIDEVQFYKDAYIYCDKWCNEGKIVEACGLNGTFNRTEFPIISKLLPLAENITFLKAVCKETGNDAVYSNINIDVQGKTTEIIGGAEKYNAVDRYTFFDNENKQKSDIVNKIKELIKIYIEKDSGKLVFDDHQIEQIDDSINQNFENINDIPLHEFAMRCIKHIEFTNTIKGESDNKKN